MNRSVLLAVGIVGGLTVWMLSGQDSQAVYTEEVKANEEAPLMKVQVMHSKAEAVQRLTRVQGQVEAFRRVEVRSEIDGTVEKLPLREGARVRAGELLVQLDDAYRPAQVSEAEARVKQRVSELAASKKLLKKGLQAENQMIADQAELQAAKASLEMARFQLQHTRIKAPFAGVLNTRSVESGDYVQKGQSVLEIVDDSRLLISGQVPQNNMAHLRIGQSVRVRLADGSKVLGKLSYISAVADSVTRSFRVEVSIDNPSKQRWIGQSATLNLPNGEFLGHWVPGSVLGLDSGGELQVKVLNAQNQVQIRKVSIIRTEEDGFWIDGLESDVTLITVGQDFVSEQQEVEPSVSGAVL